MGDIDTLVIAVGGEGKRIFNYFKKINFVKSKSLFPIDNKPLLEYLIDNALKLNFNNIFILTSFHDREIKRFIDDRYKFTKKISVITGGDKGKKGGVTYVLSLLKNKLNKPFIYSDGNILYSSNLLEELSSGKCLNKSLINIAISPIDSAPTHSRVYVADNKILDIKTRLGDKLRINAIKNCKSYCSMGVMAINNMIFDLIPEFADMYDLDYMVENIFKNQKKNDLFRVDFTIYNKDWLCIHSKRDIDNIGKKRYSNLLGS